MSDEYHIHFPKKSIDYIVKGFKKKSKSMSDKPKMTGEEIFKAVATVIGSGLVIYFVGRAFLWW